MILYGSYTSPFVRHCRIALLETGLACEFIKTDGAASAAKSPTRKVPFFEDEDIFLTDSCAIVKYLREKVGQDFCPGAIQFDLLCMVNTMLEASVNLFMLEKDGITPDQSAYLKRHVARIQSSLIELNSIVWPASAPYTDAELRLLCYLEWVTFRKLFTFNEHQNLISFLKNAQQYLPVSQTVPHL